MSGATRLSDPLKVDDLFQAVLISPGYVGQIASQLPLLPIAITWSLCPSTRSQIVSALNASSSSQRFQVGHLEVYLVSCHENGDRS